MDQIGAGLVRQQQVLNEVHADFSLALQHALRQHMGHEPAQTQRNDSDHPEAAQGKTSSQVQGRYRSRLWHGVVFSGNLTPIFTS
jgi:hypothetical protein